MRKLFAIAVLLGLASAARSDEKQVEKIYEEAATAGEKLVEALKSIKDEPTAKSALSKVTELDSLLLQSQAFQLARNNVSEQAVKLIADKYADRNKKTFEQMRAQTQRIEGMPEAYKVVKDTTFFKRFEECEKLIAELGALTLTVASETYKIKYGGYPEKLEQLVKPPDGPPFVEKDALKDPWGRSFEYDPKGPKNDGKVPDIWSHGPPHKEKGIIGNWMKK